MNKLIWIGQYTNAHLKNSLSNEGYKFLSLSRAQDVILKELIRHHKITTISSARLPLKIGKGIIFKGLKWQDESSNDHYFLNILRIPFFELIYKYHLIKLTLLNFKKYQNLSFVFYGLHSPNLLAARFIKRNFKNSKITFIVPDLPEYYDFKMNIIKRFLKIFDSYLIKLNLSYIDKYVLYSKHILRKLKIQKPFIVMEGMTEKNHELSNNNISIQGYDQYILYTGAVSHGYGLELLVKAFNLISFKNIKLNIVGSGNLSEWFKKQSKINPNIQLIGYQGNREIVLNFQRNARILINPIPPSNVATRYSFPSKLFEYLVSGSPVISFNLECLPNQYKKHLFIVKRETEDDLKDTIEHILSLDKTLLKNHCLKAQDFILHNKNSTIQVKRMLRFFK